MKYYNKINKLYLDYTKQYKRKDETFEMMTIKSIVKEVENGEYDNTEYTNAEIEAMCKYLCERYYKCMSARKEKLEERKRQGLYV